MSVTRQRSDQLSYVPRLFFNNLVIRHIESSASQLSLFSLFSTGSLLWTQFWGSVDTTWTPKWTPKSANQQRNLVYQMKQSFGVHLHQSLGKLCCRLDIHRIAPFLTYGPISTTVFGWSSLGTHQRSVAGEHLFGPSNRRIRVLL